MKLDTRIFSGSFSFFEKSRNDVSLLRKSDLFDEAWYRKVYKDVSNPGVDCVRHYVDYGAAEGRDPNPNFSTTYYVEAHPEVEASGLNPLVHYIRYGAKAGLKTKAVLGDNNQARLIAADGGLPDIADLAALSERERRRQIVLSGYFDSHWYLETHKDVAETGADALSHFVKHGSFELRNPGPEFDAPWYADHHPEIYDHGVDPLIHFINIGQFSGYTQKGDPYFSWIVQFDTLELADEAAIKQDIAQNPLPNTHAIILFDNSDSKTISTTLETISAQLFADWTATIVFSPVIALDHVNWVKNYIAGDPRFNIYTTGDDPAAEFGDVDTLFVLIETGASLREHALYELAAIGRDTAVRLLYSDHDALDAWGKRKNPTFKPDFSPEYYRQQQYLGNVLALRTSAANIVTLINACANATDSFDNSLDDIMAGIASAEVRHIPQILYHQLRSAQPNTHNYPRRLQATQLLSASELPYVSIIIPTRDKLELLQPCIESIEAKSNYPRDRLQLIVVDNGSTEPEALTFMRALTDANRATVIRDDDKFNFSRLNNRAVAEALGDVLLFVNNDTLVHDPDWIVRIATFAVQPDVGAVGGKLLYPDMTIQHGGVILGIQGVAAHDLVNMQDNDPQARIDVTREMSAVTGACLAMRKSVFIEIGMFDTVAAVAFNDTLLCLAARKAGYRNLYIREALLIHLESKSRGYDNNEEKQAKFLRECRYARSQYNDVFQTDPYYSPNLSLKKANYLAFPPRDWKPWRRRTRSGSGLNILLLSATLEIGHGVAVVVAAQAAHLVASGHTVTIGGPKGRKEFAFPGCRRAILNSATTAATFAIKNDIDCVVVETPPFFSIVRWIGSTPKTLFLDHGEPPASLFSDAETRQDVKAEKRLTSIMASGVFAISESVRAEGLDERVRVIPNGNSHLAIWTDGLGERRQKIREQRGWEDKVVVLNVCRFTKPERRYKGVDVYGDVLSEFAFLRPEQAGSVVFALCGKAQEGDVKEMTALGFDVFDNVSDEEMIDLYCAADIYLNMSRWEGYNLGIGQALALGLPVIASDIPAHRAFGVFTTDSVLLAIEKLSQLAGEVIAAGFAPARKPVLQDWDTSTALLEAAIVDLCGTAS